jgi:hypothetical protein
LASATWGADDLKLLCPDTLLLLAEATGTRVNARRIDMPSEKGLRNLLRLINFFTPFD